MATQLTFFGLTIAVACGVVLAHGAIFIGKILCCFIGVALKNEKKESSGRR